MRYSIYFATVFLFLLAACTSFEDAALTERKTFVHFYSSAVNYVGSVAEIDDTHGGFIVSGEVRYDDGRTDALIIKTDDRGQKIWERLIPKARVNAIKPLEGGYVLAGDSIQLNPGSDQVTELENTYAKLMVMDNDGNIDLVQEHMTTDTVVRQSNGKEVVLTVDYHGEALAVDQAGNIIMLGSFRLPGQSDAAFVSAYEPSDIRDSLWYHTFISLDGHGLVNSHALHVTPTSDIVWASNTFTQEQNLSRTYISVYGLEPNSAPNQTSSYGQGLDRNHSVSDLEKSSIGYGVIGTYAETNGLNANMYFLRVNAALQVIPESARYIDGENLMLNNDILQVDSRNNSSSFDEGLAIACVADGYVLAGAMTSTPTVGNGGKDILLVKLDPLGNLVWKKLLGGSGNEVVSSIRETPDHGLLIFGTNTVNGLSTMMLIKTDEEGELKD
jgi:hypothetical protein